MQVILTSFRIVAELLILVGIGMLLKQKNIVSAQTVKEMNRLVMLIFIPLNIFTSIYNSDFETDFDGGYILFILAMGILSCLGGVLLARMLTRKQREQSAFAQVSVRPNDGIFGLPLEHIQMILPKKAVFAFLREDVDRYAAEHQARIVSYFISATKRYPVYILNVNDLEICLVQAPVGASAATQILDWLIAYGVWEIISCGSCGVLMSMDENVFLIPSKALRDEGTSYHYLPPSRFVEISKTVRSAIEKTLREHHLHYEEVTTWSTDGFFREAKEKVEYRKSEGCAVVEMECSALAACAQMRNAIWGELLFTADTLADAEHYDERDWGEDSAEYALQLCIEAVLNL